jgi:DNA-binding Lrp family transcriptional regulator
MVFLVKAYILVDTVPKMVWEIAEASVKIEGVKMAHAVTGQFDVIAYAEFANMDTLRKIINKFMSLNGVQRTQTAIVVPPGLKQNSMLSSMLP